MKLYQKIALVILIVFTFASMALAAPVKKKAPVRKPPVKKVAAKPQPPKFQAAKPLPGQWIDMGKPFYLGNDSTVVFTLQSAEFTCDRVYYSSDILAPMADEKMLLLKFSLQNPGKEVITANWATCSFTTVDSSDTNREGAGMIGLQKNSEKLDIQLNPAQKVECFSTMMLPKDAQAPKLIVKPNGEGLVLRYDLHGKVKGLVAPYADPKDTTGATALSEVTAEKEKLYTGLQFDFSYTGLAFKSGKYAGREPSEEYGWAVFSGVIKNKTKNAAMINWATITPLLRTRGGNLTLGEFANIDGDGGFDTNLDPEQSMEVQYCFEVKNGATLKQLVLQEGENGRRYAYDLGEAKAVFEAPPAPVE
ncbi:MAG: hypothetical protein ACYC0V_11220 [Armatimonadota bacterium]